MILKISLSQAISADLHKLLAAEESLNWENQFLCLQKDHP